jgi:hypothetical protein
VSRDEKVFPVRRRFPPFTVEPDKTAPVTFPVVVRFSLSKLIAPLVSVIEPDPRTNVPNVVLDRKLEALPSAETFPAVRVPVVVRFSFAKLIVPDESVIEPEPKSKVPVVSVPVVVRFSLSKDIAPELSVIDPPAIVMVPMPAVTDHIFSQRSEVVPDEKVLLTVGLKLSPTWTKPVPAPTPSPAFANKVRFVFAVAPP